LWRVYHWGCSFGLVEQTPLVKLGLLV